MKYKTTICIICKKEVSAGGAAFTAHMRMHVRKEEAIEEKANGKLHFRSATENVYVEPEPYAKLGNEALQHQPDGVWDITDSLTDLSAIDPSAYFITSGEAVKKSDKLVSDLYSLAVKARSFRNKLEKARAEAKYLETHRENGKLLVKKKSPRKKKKVQNG